MVIFTSKFADHSQPVRSAEKNMIYLVVRLRVASKQNVYFISFHLLSGES